MRPLSHSELSRLTDCHAAWDFAYGGTLAGTCLAPRITAPLLREGRAWGRGVATWHQTGDISRAAAAAADSLEDDAIDLRHAGAYDATEHQHMAGRLLTMLDHYTRHAQRLPLDSVEHPFDVSVPSRTGKRASNRYRFTGYLDGVHHDAHGRAWIVEFKLRKTLSTLETLVLDRQGRRYAWAWWQHTGEQIAGVIYDERLNEAPREPKVLASGKTSSDKRQVTTDALYLQSCRATGTTPDTDTAAHLAARQWQQRHVVVFRPGELAETGAELVSLARIVADLETGRITPVRAPSPRRCPTCFYRAACPDPTDTELVDAQYERVPAKRDRKEIPA